MNVLVLLQVEKLVPNFKKPSVKPIAKITEWQRYNLGAIEF